MKPTISMTTCQAIQSTSTIRPETRKFTATGVGRTGLVDRPKSTFRHTTKMATTKILATTWIRYAVTMTSVIPSAGRTIRVRRGVAGFVRRSATSFWWGRTVANPLDVFNPWAYVVGLAIGLNPVPAAGPNGGAEPDKPVSCPCK